MNILQLTRLDEEKKMAWFYHCQILPTLFGDWVLIREWGRIGQDGQMRRDWFDDEAQAQAAQNKILARKKRKGYQ